MNELSEALLISALDPTPHEGSMVDLTNQSRQAAGLGALTYDPQLLEIARQRAQQQGLQTLNHYDPQTGQLLFWTMLQRAGILTPGGGENLARSSPWAPDAVEQALMASPTHRANILNPAWTRLAVGEASPATDTWNLAELFR